MQPIRLRLVQHWCLVTRPVCVVAMGSTAGLYTISLVLVATSSPPANHNTSAAPTSPLSATPPRHAHVRAAPDTVLAAKHTAEEKPRRTFLTCCLSMMNLPSLYFWLSSNAWWYFHPSTDCERERERESSAGRERERERELSWERERERELEPERA
jgi:hypothetical protein